MTDPVTRPTAMNRIPSSDTDQRPARLSDGIIAPGLSTLTLIHARAASRQQAGAAGYT